MEACEEEPYYDDAPLEQELEQLALLEAIRGKDACVAGVYMASSTGTAGGGGGGRRMVGSAQKRGSSVGGWGFDAGETWRPTHLPKPTPPAAAVGGNRKEKITPVETEARDILVRKDELMSIVLAKLTPYFAIIGSNGEAKFSSGQPSSVCIDSERRVGNKEVTKVRG